MVPVPPGATVEELLAGVRRGGEEAHEAALALGLLLEDRRPEDDPGIAVVVGPELAARRLSQVERDAAVEGLMEYLRDTPEPHVMAAWALAKSAEPRTVPVLIELLDSRLADPDAVPLVYQALIGIVTAGLTAPEYRASALAAVQRAATRGRSEVAETAQRYLRA